MPIHFELTRPGITSISVDGIEHKVDPATGLLQVDVMTPNLMRELSTHHMATQVDPNEHARRRDERQRMQPPPAGPLARQTPAVGAQAGAGAGPGGGSGLSAARMALDAGAGEAGLKKANELTADTPDQVQMQGQGGPVQGAPVQGGQGQGQPQGQEPQTEQQRTGAQPGALTPEEETERQALFTELDEALGNRVDRRRSLNQLREMKAKLPKS